LREKIREFNSSCSIFISGNKIARVTALNDFLAGKTTDEIQESELKTQAAKAFCALGNPENFFDQLRGEDYNLAETETFPDHHFYTKSDIEKIQNAAVQADILLTTAKDAVKLKNLDFSLPCFVVEIEMRFDDEKRFREIIQNI
jgi:tetraacyldisaccharide 4'-kinase